MAKHGLCTRGLLRKTVLGARPVSLCLLLAFLTTGCGRIKGGLKDWGSRAPAAQDFEKTEIITEGPVAADGSTPLLVAIQLKSSDNTSISDYRPTYEVTSHAGITANQCTKSDRNGVAVCILKSIKPGIKTLTLTNAKVGLTANLEFTAPHGIQRLGFIPACQVNASTPQGSRVQVGLGNALKGERLKTSGGYQVTFSMQGMVSQ